MLTTTTTKSLIFISLIITFAVALQDGDQIAFKTHGSLFNAKYQYLNAGTVDGSVGMAADTNKTTASGTWWKAHNLTDGSWGFESLGNIPNAQHIYLNANTYTGTVDLAASTDYATLSGTHWALESLSDGNVALRSLGSFKNTKFLYLNAGTANGSINLAADTDPATASGTHWEIVTLVAAAGSAATAAATADIENIEIPAANSQLADFIQTHADDLKNEPDVDVNYCVQQFASTTFQSQYGELMGNLIEAGCINGLQACDVNDLNGILTQLQQNGWDIATIKQIHVLIGSMIGSSVGGEACDGVSACEWLGGKIGAALTCLSVSKEVFEGVVKAVSTLKDVANQAGDIGQDAVKTITDTANTVQNGVQTAIDQLQQGAENDAVDTLTGVTDDVGQGFTDIGNAIANGLTDAGNAIADAGQQAVDAVGNGVTQAADAVGNGFCSVFGC